MTADPSWSQPLPNWQQGGSFAQQATPPAASPVSGTLIQLPCINEDWLPLVLGALDQLRNPSTWLDSLTDPQRADVIGQVDYLRSVIAMGINVPCCNVGIRLTAQCALQFTTDGGTHWSDVTDWDTNFPGCVKANVPPTAPPNPNSLPAANMACNVASMIARDLMEKVMQIYTTGLQAQLKLIQIANNIWDSIGFAFPIGDFFVRALIGYATYATQANISDFENAAIDPVLWSKLTCAIYNAIATDGWITAGNEATVVSNICAMGYTPSDVQNAICAFVSVVGLQLWQQMQTYAALEDADCSGCVAANSHCYLWTFLPPGGNNWTNISPYTGTWASGIGYEGEFNSGSGEYLIYLDTSQVAKVITGIDLILVAPSGLFTNLPAIGSLINLRHSGALVQQILLPTGVSYIGATKLHFAVPTLTVDQFQVRLVSPGAGLRLQAVQVQSNASIGYPSPAPCTF